MFSFLELLGCCVVKKKSESGQLLGQWQPQLESHLKAATKSGEEKADGINVKVNTERERDI